MKLKIKLLITVALALLSVPVAKAQTQYSTGVAIAGGTGVITVTYDGGANGIPQLGGANTIILTPFVAKAALSDTNTGNIDWACASVAKTTATNQGLGAAAAGTVLAKYVPTACK